MSRRLIVPPSVLGRILRGHPLEPTLRRMGVDDTPIEIMQSPRDPMFSAMQSYAAEHPPTNSKIVDAPAGARMVKFDEHDYAGWLTSFFSWFGQIKKHAFVRPMLDATPIPNDARIALFGDWGTGLYGAPLVAQQVSKLAPDVAIHLGDVYFSGTKSEQKERCLNLWPSTPKISRACNGNHDMYSGGHGLFDVTLAAFAQPSTCFALMNDHWLVLGLDSAYVDADISDQQIEWAASMATKYAPRAVLICTHHQPWAVFDGSSFESGFCSRLLAKVPRVNSWYFGHEHRAVIYNVHPKYNVYGRCFGNGGFPEAREPFVPPLVPVGAGWGSFNAANVDGVTTPGGIVLDIGNATLGEKYFVHGFATVTLARGEIHESAFDESGAEVWRTSRRI